MLIDVLFQMSNGVHDSFLDPEVRILLALILLKVGHTECKESVQIIWLLLLLGGFVSAQIGQQVKNGILWSEDALSEVLLLPDIFN